MLIKEKTFDFNNNEIKDFTKKSIANLSFSIIKHQRKYKKKGKSD
jgi:hypothetical protein